MPKFKVEMNDGNTYMVEADTPPTEEEMTAFISEQNNKTPLLVEAGNAFSRAAISTLGVPGEAINLARNIGEYATGTPWAETTKMRDSGIGGFGFDALDNAFGENGLELYKTKDLGTDASARMAQRIGGLAGGIASGGLGVKQSLPTMARLLGWGTAGGTIGGEIVDPRLPKEYQGMGEAGGQLLGVATGALRSIKAPPPKPGLSDATLNDMVVRGKKTSVLPDTMMEQADMMSEGGPAGPIRPPEGGATPRDVALGEGAQGILNQLELTRQAKQTTRKRAAEMLAPVKEATTPSLLDRVAYKTGTASKEAAYKTAVYDAITEVENVIPKSKTLTGKLMKEIPKHIYLRYRLGKYAAARETGSRLIDELTDLMGLNPNPSQRQLEALKKLETIIRTGEPIPTKGTAVKRAVQEGASSVGGLMNSIAERYGVDAGNGVVMGSGPILRKPSSLLKENEAWHGSPYDFDEFSDTHYLKGEGENMNGQGTYETKGLEVGKGYARLRGPESDGLTMKDSKGRSFNTYDDNISGKLGLGTEDITDEHIRLALDKLPGKVVSAGSLDSGYKSTIRDFQELRELSRMQGSSVQAHKYDKAVFLLKYFQKRGLEPELLPPGTLYKVMNEVSDSDLIDFTRPLSQQSDRVQDGLFNALRKYNAPKGLLDSISNSGMGKMKDLTGEEAFWDVANFLDKNGPGHRRGLLEQGVQGNKYKGIHSGEQNLVIFDPKKIKILEKLKIPLYSVAGGGFMVQMQDLPPELQETLQ